MLNSLSILNKPLNDEMAQLISNNKLCRNFTNYIQLGYQNEINLFMGIGFISNKYGLSSGLPIDILNMIIVAQQVCLKLTQLNIKTTLHLLIADHMAQVDLKGLLLEQAKSMGEHYYEKIHAICTNLNMRSYTKLHFSSEIIASKRFQIILENLQNRNNSAPINVDPLVRAIMNCEEGYDASNKFYFLNQTALGQYFYEVERCAIKISWSKHKKAKDIFQSCSHDEPHFDRFFKKMLPALSMSFIYVECGRNCVNDTAEVPYCAPSGLASVRILFDNTSPPALSEKCHLAINIDYYYHVLQLGLLSPRIGLADKIRLIQQLGMSVPCPVESMVKSSAELVLLPTEAAKNEAYLYTLAPILLFSHPFTIKEKLTAPLLNPDKERESLTKPP